MSMITPWGLSDEQVVKIKQRQRREAERRYMRYRVTKGIKDFALGGPAAVGILIFTLALVIEHKVDDIRAKRRS